MRVVIVSSFVIVAIAGGLWLATVNAGRSKPVARPKAIDRSERANPSPARVAVSAPPPQVRTVRAFKPVASSEHEHPIPAMSVDEQPLHNLFVEDGTPVAESWRFRNAIKQSLDAVRSTTNEAAREGVTLESLDCRYRLCRIVLVFDSTTSGMRIMERVFMTGTTEDYPQGFGAITVPARTELPDGRIRATLYVAREGDLKPPGTDELHE